MKSNRKELPLVQALELLETVPSVIVIDLEVTNGIPWNEREIIEMGAVSRGMKIRGKRRSFHRYVKPTLHPTAIIPWAQSHSINIRKILKAPSFPEAFVQFFSEIWDEAACLASWGEFDYLMLKEEFQRHQEELSRYGFDRFPIPVEQFVNLKHLAMQFFHLKGEKSLSEMLAYIGMRFRGKHHRALPDAKNTAKILDFIMNGYVYK